MKTLKKTFMLKLDNEFLADILAQLINQYHIIQIFYTQNDSESPSNLVVNVKESGDAKQLQLNKWVEKARAIHNIHISFLYSARLEKQHSIGNPFIELHCQPDAIIYQNEESENPLIINRNWKKYKRKLSEFEERFFNDHEIIIKQIRMLLNDGSSNSIFKLYEKLIEFDLEYLEDISSGNVSKGLNLNERIHQVIKYFPDIQKLFVKKNSRDFYLMDIINDAKDADAEVETFYKDEMYEAVENAENGLYSLIELKFNEFRKNIKKRYSKSNQNVNLNHDNKDENRDEILDAAVERILTFAELEEIYLFHQTTYGENVNYYLLLVGLNVGTDKLNSMTQSLKSHLGDHYDFVLISHDRYWIQKNLYQNQNFFSFIMQKDHLKYFSNSFHAEPHWEMPHKPYHADIYFHYRSTKDAATQLIKIADDPDENFQGLPNLFAMFFLSFCRTYIFIKTFYMPNYLSTKTLWHLCQYADADFRKYDYLFDHFFTDIFNFMDYNMKVHHSLSKIDKAQVEQISNLVQILMNDMDKLVSNENLLSDFQKKLVHGKVESSD